MDTKKFFSKLNDKLWKKSFFHNLFSRSKILKKRNFEYRQEIKKFKSELENLKTSFKGNKINNSLIKSKYLSNNHELLSKQKEKNADLKQEIKDEKKEYKNYRKNIHELKIKDNNEISKLIDKSSKIKELKKQYAYEKKVYSNLLRNKKNKFLIFDEWKKIKEIRTEINLRKKLILDKDVNIIPFNNKFNFDENVFEIKDFNFWYKKGKFQALHDINLNIKKKKVTAFIGPSGCGKTTLLWCLNRMHDFTEDSIKKGNIWFNGKNIYSRITNPIELRTSVGMVFQKPSPFPVSIYDNIAYALKSHGITDKFILDKLVYNALQDAGLLDEVKNKLDEIATGLSGGQQQRLCIARAIAVRPSILLMDEPTSALDPIASAKIENLIQKLKSDYTIIIVSHSLSQTKRISDQTVFFYNGKIIESGPTRDIFTSPRHEQTKDYLYGRL